MARKQENPPIGPALRAFRQDRNYTIEQVAARAKVHTVYYGDVERAKRNPTVRVLDRILTALQVSWTELGAAVDELKQSQ